MGLTGLACSLSNTRDTRQLSHLQWRDKNADTHRHSDLVKMVIILSICRKRTAVSVLSQVYSAFSVSTEAETTVCKGIQQRAATSQKSMMSFVVLTFTYSEQYDVSRR